MARYRQRAFDRHWVCPTDLLERVFFKLWPQAVIQQVVEQINKTCRLYSHNAAVNWSLILGLLSQVTSYRRTFDVGCHLRIHQQTIILHAKYITPERPRGLYKATLSKNGKRRVRFCEFMETICISRLWTSFFGNHHHNACSTDKRVVRAQISRSYYSILTQKLLNTPF